MKQSFDIKRASAPIQVLYIANKSSTFSSVITYIQGMCNEMWKDFDSMFRRDSITIKWWKVLNFWSWKKILWRIVFISAKEDDAWLGMFADLIIIDEAGLVPKQVYDNITPIVLLEWAKLLCISTMYEDSIKWRFYQNLVDWEKRNILSYKQETFELYEKYFKWKELKHWDANKWFVQATEEFYKKNHIISLRYTIDDVDIFDEYKINSIKEETLKKSYTAYLSELYSRFVDTWKVFNYEESIVNTFDNSRKYKYVVLSYDPATLSDWSWICILWYDDAKRKIIPLFADYLDSFTGQYQEQIQQIMKIDHEYRKYTDNEEQFFKVADSTQWGIIDAFEVSNYFFDKRYRWTSWNDVVNSMKIYNEIKIPKKILVDCVNQAFNNKYIEIPQKNIKLTQELESYQKVTHSNGKIEYIGVGSRDDIVSAFMMWVYFLYNDLWIKYELSDYSNKYEYIDTETRQEQFNKMLLQQQNLQQEYETVRWYFLNNPF
jgi:hypothetical protein